MTIKTETKARYETGPNGFATASGLSFEAENEIVRQAAEILESRINSLDSINSPADAAQCARMKMAALQHEELWALWLNTEGKPIGWQRLASGTINSAAIYPREVVKEAIAVNAKSVIFFHNHPSGNLQPSEQDIRITETLKNALALFDVSILDHLVVSVVGFTSLSEQGLM